MKNGIFLQHGHTARKHKNAVRSDITAIIGFALPSVWPEDMEEGDFFEILLLKEQDLVNHPLRSSVDPASQVAVRNFFVNGGEEAHLFAVCIKDLNQVYSGLDLQALMGGLLDRLRSEEDIALIISPAAAYFPIYIHKNGDVEVASELFYELLLSHCQEMNNRFLIIDPPMTLHERYLYRWIEEFRNRNASISSYGAIYYPWLNYREQSFPPSASMAGLYVRIERDHPPIGIHWPPGNIPLEGVTHAEIELEWNESEKLSQNSINPLVVQPGRGIVPLGVRTLSFDATFKHINSRRILNLIVEQVRRDNMWAVFETNNTHLWAVLNRDIRYRLKTFWDAGLLLPNENGTKFEVLCDEMNNPTELRDAGFVNVEIRVKPVGSIEQIVIDLNIGGAL